MRNTIMVAFVARLRGKVKGYTRNCNTVVANADCFQALAAAVALRIAVANDGAKALWHRRSSPNDAMRYEFQTLEEYSWRLRKAHAILCTPRNSTDTQLLTVITDVLLLVRPSFGERVEAFFRAKNALAIVTGYNIGTCLRDVLARSTSSA